MGDKDKCGRTGDVDNNFSTFATDGGLKKGEEPTNRNTNQPTRLFVLTNKHNSKTNQLKQK